MQLLLVEGSPTIASGITNHLKGLGFDRCQCVASADEALRYLREQPVDLLITGWTLAERSGVAFTRQVRARADCRHLPVLMISPHDDHTRVLQALQAGVDGYLLRPFAPADLAAKIEELAVRAPGA